MSWAPGLSLAGTMPRGAQQTGWRALGGGADVGMSVARRARSLGLEDLPMYLLAFVAGALFAGFVGTLPDRIFHKNLDRAAGREFSRAHPRASWVRWVYPWVAILAALFQFIVFTPLMMPAMQNNATAGCVAFFLWPAVVFGGVQGVIGLFELLAGVSPTPPPGRGGGRIYYGRDEPRSMAGCFRILLSISVVAVFLLVCLCAAL